MTETTSDASSRPTEAQANGFESVRLAHQNEIAEDYVELVAELIEQKGEARPVDIAECLGVSQPTVSKNLTRLKRDNLVTHVPYRSVFLTSDGMALAETCRRRHQIVVSFLKAIGVPADVAEHDAEGIEHHVSIETVAAFSTFVEAQGNE